MYSCIKSFMDNDKENGLLLLDMPTGFGKTYSVIKYIAEFIKENSDTGKKIFFITTLKKNLPVEELKRRLDEMELLHLFEERVIELKSNVDTVVANYNSSMYNDIPLEIRNSEEFKNFKADVEFLKKHTGQNSDLVRSVRNNFSNNNERIFRAYMQNTFARNFPSIKERLLAGHRILAISRGEKEKFLTVKIDAPVDRILSYLDRKLITAPSAPTAAVLHEVTEDAYNRLIAPAIEREIRNDLFEKAEDGAIRVFGKNLEQLLMQPPIAGQVVLGWDPAFRTGCKLAVVDPTGKVLDTTVIYPTAPQNRVDEAKAVLKKLISKYHITLISLGNGTASRESEQIIVQLLKEIPEPVQYIIVNEAGASVYSASKLATEEFPQFDVGQRSAASMARRLQDPLAELVKIDPKSIGVGQYQHDMNQKKLTEALDHVVEDCVNRVGVDLNTASASLLEYVSGVSKAIAKNIVVYREENGKFASRSQLLKVAKLGPKAYEQCAGFMRISDGKNPLDATGVHPESYAATKH